MVGLLSNEPLRLVTSGILDYFVAIVSLSPLFLLILEKPPSLFYMSLVDILFSPI